MPVILDRRAASAGVDHDGIQALAIHLARPCLDIFGRCRVALGGLAHVMRQRPAAARALGHHHLAAQPGQQANGGIVDIGVERALRTARHQRHPLLARTLRGEGLRIVIAADRRHLRRCHLQHRAQPCVGHQRREGPPDLGPEQSDAKAHWIGQDARQDPAQGTIPHGALVTLLDIFAGLIHQMHIMHPRGTGRHAGQARQAPVDMLDRFRVRVALILQHVLDEIDTPARAIELIAQHLIGGAGGGAEPAMHARAQDLVGARDLRVFKLFGGEFGLHMLSLRARLRRFRPAPSGRG